MTVTVEEALVVRSPSDREYRRFVADVYAHDPFLRRINEPFLNAFLGHRDMYARRCFVKPVMVTANCPERAKNVPSPCHTRPLAAAILVSSLDSPVLRISFLEFVPDAGPALEYLVKYAIQVARDRGLTSISIGVNGQINYGVGILEHDGTARPEFNSTYNPPYYAPLLDAVADKLGFTKTPAHAYTFTPEELEAIRDDDLMAHLASTYTYRVFDKRRWREESLLFGELCDKTLTGTPRYSPKSAREMAETISPMRWIMGPSDIVFAYKGDEPVGTVYGHPDYAENLNSPKTGLLGLALAARRKPSTTIIVDFLGVLPQHRRSGLALGMLYTLLALNRARVTRVRSTFVLDDNLPGHHLSHDRAQEAHRTYAIYEKDL